jgi:hypothetical protein
MNHEITINESRDICESESREIVNHAISEEREDGAIFL